MNVCVPFQKHRQRPPLMKRSRNQILNKETHSRKHAHFIRRGMGTIPKNTFFMRTEISPRGQQYLPRRRLVTLPSLRITGACYVGAYMGTHVKWLINNSTLPKSAKNKSLNIYGLQHGLIWQPGTHELLNRIIRVESALWVCIARRRLASKCGFKNYASQMIFVSYHQPA